MNNQDLLEIAQQLKQLNKNQEIANYLKLYEITKEPKILEYVCSLMGVKMQQSDVSKQFK